MAERANNRKRTTRSVFIALFAAIIGVSGFVAIPAGPAGVPIVLQNMMVLLAGTVLGGFQGAAAVGLYILGGVLGLPVFAGGRSGLASLASPSGGFIVGYFIGAAAAGIFLQAPSVEEQRVTARQSFRVALASIICFVLIYCFGIAHMVKVLKLTVPQGIAAGFLPFALGDGIKLLIGIPLAIKLRPVVARYISPEGEEEARA